jgi:hypothetical protein
MMLIGPNNQGQPKDRIGERMRKSRVHRFGDPVK